MITEAARVVLRRLIRARQRSSATDAATRAIALRMPPTIAAIFLPVLLWGFNLDDKKCACEDDRPGTVVCDEVGVGSEVMVAGSPGLISTWSVKVNAVSTSFARSQDLFVVLRGTCDDHSLPSWCAKIGSQIPSFYFIPGDYQPVSFPRAKRGRKGNATYSHIDESPLRHACPTWDGVRVPEPSVRWGTKQASE
jgi:hypothetical protein